MISKIKKIWESRKIIVISMAAGMVVEAAVIVFIKFVL